MLSGIFGVMTPINSEVLAEPAPSDSGFSTKKIVETVIVVAAVIWIAYQFFPSSLERELKRVASFGEIDVTVQEVFVNRVVIQSPLAGHYGIGLRHVFDQQLWSSELTNGIPHPGGDALNLIIYPSSYFAWNNKPDFVDLLGKTPAERVEMIVRYKKALLKFIKASYQMDAGSYTSETTVQSALTVLQARFSYVYEWNVRPFDFHSYHGLGKLGKIVRPVGSVKRIEPLTFENLGMHDSFRTYGKLTQNEFRLLRKHIASCMLKTIFSNPPTPQP